MGKKIKEIKNKGYSIIPYNRFFPYRIVYENGTLQNNRDYSIAFKTDDISQIDRIIEMNIINLQIVIDSDGYFIIPTMREDKKKDKKGEVFSTIESLKNCIPGIQLDGGRYLKQIQGYLNKGGNIVISLASDLVSPKIKANINHVVCDNVFYRTIYLRFVPDDVDSSFLQKVLDMPESLISIHIKPASIIANELPDEHRAEYKNAAPSLQKIENELLEGITYFYVGVYILLSSGDMETLDKRTDELLRVCPSIMDTATHNQEDGVLSTLPYGADKLQIRTLISESELYNLLPTPKGGRINELEHIL